MLVRNLLHNKIITCYLDLKYWQLFIIQVGWFVLKIIMRFVVFNCLMRCSYFLEYGLDFQLLLVFCLVINYNYLRYFDIHLTLLLFLSYLDEIKSNCHLSHGNFKITKIPQNSQNFFLAWMTLTTACRQTNGRHTPLEPVL